MIKIPDILNPRYPYGGGKIYWISRNKLCKKILQKIIIFRPHNVYGSDMEKEHVIPELKVKLKIKMQKKLVIQGLRNETRSFIHKWFC